MAIVMGPVLKFVGQETANNKLLWHVSALIVTDGEEPDGRYEYDGVAPAQPAPRTLLRQHRQHKVLRYDMAVPRAAAETTVTYTIDGTAKPDFDFHVPALNGQFNIAYASCNGFSEPGLMKDVNDHFAMWEDLRTCLPETPEDQSQSHAHLLVMGGDQIYADSIWLEKSVLGNWSALDNDEANKSPVTPEMQEALEDFYFTLYVKRWAWPSNPQRKHSAHAMASIPTLMMWDDHDIIDGWGSYSVARNTCPMFQALFREAEKNFDLFQQQHVRHTNLTHSGYMQQNGPYTFLHVIDGVAILGLDLRFERTPTQVISKEHWKEIYSRLEALKAVRHVLVLSSIPLVHADFTTVQTGLSLWPGQQELEDDLLDHWDNEQHSEERLRFIHRLSRLADDKSARITILSGDVHIGALGIIENSRAELKHGKVVINQLTSSGIVHPPPGGIARYVIEQVFATTDSQVDQGIVARLVPPGAGKRLFVGSRNWLSLDIEPGEKGRIWVKWHAENDPGTPRTKVIHPVGA